MRDLWLVIFKIVHNFQEGCNGKKMDQRFWVFFGNEQFQRKNCEGLIEKVSGRLSKWRWLLPQLSYRGRVLVANNLAASILWHKTIVMEPPEEMVSTIQRTIVNFFWNGQHWTRAAVLYLPVQEGGQGLVDVRNRICAFRIQAAQRFLYDKDVERLQVRSWGELVAMDLINSCF